MKYYQLNTVIGVNDHVDKADLRKYVHDALRSYGGAFMPIDPLFDGAVTQGSIRLERIEKQKSRVVEDVRK